MHIKTPLTTKGMQVLFVANSVKLQFNCIYKKIMTDYKIHNISPASTTTFVSSDEPDATLVNTQAASNCNEGLVRGESRPLLIQYTDLYWRHTKARVPCLNLASVLQSNRMFF